MDACSLDWKAIAGFTSAGATLIGARVAWCISNNWRYQKASEEVSKESKDLWNKLDELENLYNRLDDIIKLPAGLEYKSEVISTKDKRLKFFFDIKEWKYVNISKMEFVKILTDNKDVTNSIEDLIDKLDSTYSQNLVQRFINDEDIIKHVDRDEVIKKIDKLKNNLIPFIKHSKIV